MPLNTNQQTNLMEDICYVLYCVKKLHFSFPHHYGIMEDMKIFFACRYEFKIFGSLW